MAFTRDWICSNCKAVSPDVPTSIPDQFCPFCGTQMTKILTPPLVMFRGEGWTPKFSKEQVNGKRSD